MDVNAGMATDERTLSAAGAPAERSRHSVPGHRVVMATLLGATLLTGLVACSTNPVAGGRAGGDGTTNHPSRSAPTNSAPAASPSTTAGAGTATGAGQAQVVTIEATGKMRFQPDTVRVHTGRVTIRLHNIGDLPHQMKIEGVAHSTIPLVLGGETKQVTFTVTKAGRYALVCDWHKAEGMTATLVVTAGG